MGWAREASYGDRTAHHPLSSVFSVVPFLLLPPRPVSRLPPPLGYTADMRVGIDAHMLGTQAGGNETFMRNLLRGLRAVAPGLDAIAYVHPDAPRDPDFTCGWPGRHLTTRSSWLRVPYGLPQAVRLTGADLLHVQYIAPPRCPAPFVVTLHDMGWLRVPETFRLADRLRLRALVGRSVRGARRVIAVTDAMRREAIATYGLDPDRVDVVPNAVAPSFRPVQDAGALREVRAKYRLPQYYVAFLGQLQPRKNVVRLARAVARLDRHGLPHALVVIGRESWRYAEVARGIAALNLGDRLRFTGYADADDLPALLAGADAFAYPSLYEGFGLPVAEAMACGVPTLISTDPALCEVAGVDADGTGAATARGAAMAVDPRDEDAIEQGLVALLTDQTLRARLREAGPQRAAQYTPEAAGRAALACYERALGRKLA